jgi:hypothetical protein
LASFFPQKGYDLVEELCVLSLATIIPPPVLILSLMQVERMPAWLTACLDARYRVDQLLGMDG